ncbi:FAD-dependent oxidoreductase [Lentisphaera marina]|uniref:FAD-dependent oxidoreductase n=1 Tax=Lentisphaera marina TaxID=1111041 RepID=UPI0023667DE6|nr:FAD-dependent oxidoreductase [Lentisphaera marina]MDD7985293.1 FAD-dependent oxidoreductase [Lentisphaera marina]
MDRRQFLKSKIAGTAILASSGLVFKADAQNLPTPSGESPDMLDVDVLVVGGGSAGHVAAIQAGRMGAKTVLLERNSQLGGTTTTGGVCFPGLFHAWGKQLISGIGWELVKKSREVDCKPLQDFSVANKGHVYYHVNINGQLYSLLAEEACLDAGVSLAYYQFPEKVSETADGWLVDVVGQGVRYQLRCKQIIDCSGGATVAGMLGMERMRGEERQPGTHSVIYKGFDMAVVNKNKKKIQEMYKVALKEGRLKKGDTWGGNAFQPIRSKSGNCNHIFGADSSTAATQTQTNLAGRKSILRMLKFLKTIPGGEKASIDRMMTETASRETYRIKGERVLTVNDYTSGRVFKDSLCYSFYPIDLHDENGVKPKKLKPGTYPTIPRSCLIPKGSKNFMVAGRCLSSDRLANSAARVQATCMAMGQATAVTAVLAAKKGITPGDVDLAEIRTELKKHNAIVIGELQDA